MPGSLSLTRIVDTRFATAIYTADRILGDKVYIKELFAGSKLRAFLSTDEGKKVEELCRELDEEFVSNADTWKMVEVFVGVETPVRVLLRMSDGERANLTEICYGYEVAQKASLAAATKAEAKHPEKCAGLVAEVTKVDEMYIY
jgi:hypothetical protein